MHWPLIIQGGMGVAISNWRLAKTVSQLGQLGVVSSTGLNRILISRLMDGDSGGHMRRALQHFPLAEPVEHVLRRYYIPNGKASGVPYKTPPMYTLSPSLRLDQLTVIANFVEVFLAKESHHGLVGINLLEKIQMQTLASLYGALLAGVDYVLIGAGIPTQVPRVLEQLAAHQNTDYRINVSGATKDDDYRMHFAPEQVFPGITRLTKPLQRPYFLPIISSVTLAQTLLKRAEGKVDGFVIEAPTAGGHNAPPRGMLTLNAKGEPLYGERDAVDLAKMKELGRPFWLAGGYGHPKQLQNALAAGATGIQVGTAFSLCDESGLDVKLKKVMLQAIQFNEAEVLTSPTASPAGFPFKVAQLPNTLAESSVYAARERICDYGALRTPFKRTDGSIGYRCPAEPIKSYVNKGGEISETEGKVCLCNSLAATAGYPQLRRTGYVEPPLVTAGNDFAHLENLMSPSRHGCCTVQDVLGYLLPTRLNDVEAPIF